MALAGTLGLGGVLVLGSARPAAADTVQFAACNYTISAPGTYVLATDLTCSSAPGPLGFPLGIWVIANNVRLVLGNRTLAGGGADFGILAQNVTGLRIEGGTVTGFSEEGLHIEAAPGARIAGVTASGNGGDGIDLQDCAGCLVAGNRASGNGNIGIHFVGSGPNTRVTGSTATDNQAAGIGLFAGSTGDRLTGNLATGNGEFDLIDNNLPACVNTWRGNRFATDNETGAAAGPGAGCIQ